MRFMSVAFRGIIFQLFLSNSNSSAFDEFFQALPEGISSYNWSDYSTKTFKLKPIAEEHTF